MMIETASFSSDEALALGYLLHVAEAPDLIEQRLLSDRAFFELLESTEEDLLRRYLQGDLPEETYRAVEGVYLRSPALRRSIESTRALLSASGLLSVGEIGVMPFLAALAKQGYVLAVIDGIDCIHEFFDQCWPELSDKKSHSEQILERFVAFVRPRLVEVCWFRERYMDAGPIELPLAMDERDTTLLSTTFKALETVEQHATRIRFQRQTTEREAADRCQIDRYRLRQVLAAALGNLSHRMASRLVSEELNVWQSVSLLWHDGLTIKGASAVLEVPCSQIITARDQALRAIALVLN